LEANRLGCATVGYDINPMAYWIVRQEIEALDLDEYRKAAARVESAVRGQIGALYQTTCTICWSEVPVKYFIWVKTQRCDRCGNNYDLFPGYVLAENERHPKYVVICSSCGELNEVEDRKSSGRCLACGVEPTTAGPAARSRCRCPHCGAMNRYPDPSQGAPTHRMVAIEYHCDRCRSHHRGRFFKKPDADDLYRFAQSSAAWRATTPKFAPDDEIPRGDETDRPIRTLATVGVPYAMLLYERFLFHRSQ